MGSKSGIVCNLEAVQVCVAALVMSWVRNRSCRCHADLQDHGEKLSDEDRGEIDEALENLKNTLSSEDAAAEEIKERISDLSAASQKIGQAMYDGAADDNEDVTNDNATEDADYKEK